ncbi:unnamed protein product, partial [Rotaria sordida]
MIPFIFQFRIARSKFNPSISTAAIDVGASLRNILPRFVSWKYL